MKSEVTLRLDEDLKERAERLADRRGTTISTTVEERLRALLREGTGTPKGDANGPESDPLNSVPPDLPPRTRRMLDEIGPATESLDLDADTRAWVDAAHEKHQ